MQQQDGNTRALAKFGIAQSQTAGFQFARSRRFGIDSRFGRGLGDRKPGDKSVDLAVSHPLGGDDREQPTDRQCRTRRRHDPPQGASCRRFHDIGNFGRLDFEEFFARGKALPLLLEPADDLALGHRQAPFRHRDRGDFRAHSAPRSSFPRKRESRSG